jgi:hypothetical protein
LARSYAPLSAKKGRDFFDLAIALQQGGVDPERIVTTFAKHMDHGGHNITRALFEQNIRQRNALGGQERVLNVEERLKDDYRAANPKPIKGALGNRG